MTATPVRPFSPRQLQIVEGIGRGLTNAEIARELGCALDTVRAHLRVIADRLPEPRGFPVRSRVLLFVLGRPSG